MISEMATAETCNMRMTILVWLWGPWKKMQLLLQLLLHLTTIIFHFPLLHWSMCRQSA